MCMFVVTSCIAMGAVHVELSQQDKQPLKVCGSGFADA